MNQNADLNRLFRKAIMGLIGLLLIMMVGFVLIYTVFRPIMWVANMLGRIDDFDDIDPGWEEKIPDYRGELDELTKEHHIGYVYAEMLACSMDEKYTHDIRSCIAHVQSDGSFDEDIDTDPSGSFLLYSPDIREFEGTIPDEAYEDIWIPFLYERDHYKEEEVLDSETGDPKVDANGNPITEWMFDYTEDEIFKDACTAYEPEIRCRKIRDGFWTFPYIPPAAGDPEERYGYRLINEDTNVEIELNTSDEYQPGYVLAVSTGEVVDTGDDGDGAYIVQRIENNGTEFYAKYTSVFGSIVTEGDELEQNEIIGLSDRVTVTTYFEENGEQLFFNPMLLFSTSQPWKYGDTYEHREYEETIPGMLQPGGILEIEGVRIDFDSKYYTFAANGITGNPCVCDANNHIAWPYNNCSSRSITGSWNKMICSSYAAGRYWEVNNPGGSFPLPVNWDQKLSIDHVPPGGGSYSRDPNKPIPQSIASIRFGAVRHDVFIEGVGEDGSVLISECNATRANSYGFRVRRFASMRDFLNSYGAVLEGMYGP